MIIVLIWAKLEMMNDHDIYDDDDGDFSDENEDEEEDSDPSG